jgi:transposase-like protein
MRWCNVARRRYTDEQRASALAALEANAGDVRKTARELNIPEATLRQWKHGLRHPESVQMSAAQKPPLAEALREVARQLLESIPGKIGESSLSQVAVAMGIAVDKAQLLEGKPTGIQDTVLTVQEEIILAAGQGPTASRPASLPLEQGALPSVHGRAG